MQFQHTKTLYGLTTLFLLIITLSSTAFAKTVTETKTFTKSLPNCKSSEAMAKHDSQRACRRVSGKLAIKSMNCECAKKNSCKTVLVAACTYNTVNKQPLYKNKRSETFGIKGGSVKSKTTHSNTSKGKDNSNKITQTQVLKSRSALNSRKRCMRLQKQEAVDKAKFGCRNVIGKMKLLKYDCECISAAPNLYDCVGLLKASCTFDKGQIKSYKEFDSERARSRHGFGMLEDMIQE